MVLSGLAGLVAGAMERHKLGGAEVAHGSHEFANNGHAGGDDQGLASTGSIYQRQMVVLKACAVIRGGDEVFEESMGLSSKRELKKIRSSSLVYRDRYLLQ